MGQSTRKSSRAKVRSAGAELTRELVFADPEPVYNKFQQKLRPEIERALAAITAAHLAMDSTQRDWPKNAQAQYVRLFLHTALGNLVLATHFIVAGYFQAAGQQLRSYAEACAMAMLLLVPNQWSQFEAAPDRFPAHEALQRVRSKPVLRFLKAAVSLDAKRWDTFMRLARLYDHHSHAGALTAFLHIRMTWPGKSILGGEYDPSKRAEYAADLGRAAAGARSLAAEIKAIARHFSNAPATG